MRYTPAWTIECGSRDANAQPAVRGVRHLNARIGSEERRLGESDIRTAMQHIANGKTDVLGRPFFRRHLVEQRLEGVLVVLVDERDPDVGTA
jgi:hypothetical protein